MRTMNLRDRIAAALKLSDIWYNGWISYKDDPVPVYRQFALKCKTKAVVVHDQVLTNRKVDSRHS